MRCAPCGRNPGFSAAVILVTSLGIAATTSVFGLVDGLMLKPLPVRDPERLVYFASPGFSYPIFSETRARGAGMFSGFFAWNLESVNVDWNGELEPAEVLMATGDFYSTLGVQAALGRTFNADDDRPGGGASGLVAVISHGCWQRRFGSDGSVIGRIVRIDRRPFTIVGVAPRGFFGVAAGLAPDITIPLTAIQDSRSAHVDDKRMAASHGTAARRCQPRAGQRCAQEHLARSARGDDEPRRTGRPAGQVSGPGRRAPRRLRRFLSRPEASSPNLCGSSSRWSGCCSPSRAPAPPICCWLEASRVSARSRCGWRSAQAVPDSCASC